MERWEEAWRNRQENARIVRRLLTESDREQARLQALRRRVAGLPPQRGHRTPPAQRETLLDRLDRYIGLGDLSCGRLIRLTILMREFGNARSMPEISPALFRSIPRLAHFAPLAEQILGAASKRRLH